MQGSDKTNGSLFSYMDLEDRVPAAHPLPVIREVVNDALADLDAFARQGSPNYRTEHLVEFQAAVVAVATRKSSVARCSMSCRPCRPSALG